MRALTKDDIKHRQPVERPAPAPTYDPADLARVMADAVRQIELPTPQITVQAPKIEPKITLPAGADPITKWVFSVQRDKDGLIQTITAEAA